MYVIVSASVCGVTHLKKKKKGLVTPGKLNTLLLNYFCLALCTLCTLCTLCSVYTVYNEAYVYLRLVFLQTINSILCSVEETPPLSSTVGTFQFVTPSVDDCKIIFLREFLHPRTHNHTNTQTQSDM